MYMQLCTSKLCAPKLATFQLHFISAAGQSTHRVKKRLRGYFREAVLHQPSVLLLDDLDHCVPVFEDAQELVGEEGTASIKKAQGKRFRLH